MSHFTETYMEDISLPDFQNGRSDIPADRHEGQDNEKVFYTPKPYPRVSLSFIGQQGTNKEVKNDQRI